VLASTYSKATPADREAILRAFDPAWVSVPKAEYEAWREFRIEESAPARPPWPMNGPFRALFRNQQWLVVDRDSVLIYQCLCETEAKALVLALNEFPAAVEWMREHADRYPLDDNTPSTEKATRASRNALLARVGTAGFDLTGEKETERCH
jgi:hypothetical protein